MAGKVGKTWTPTTPLNVDQVPIDSRECYYTRCLNNDQPTKIMVNNIYFPHGCHPFMIICSCGAMIIGHSAWKIHLSKCNRAIDFAKNKDSTDIETFKNTEYMDPIDLATYKKLAETPEFGKYKNYVTLRYHHLDQWVCQCGSRSISYERLVEGHQKKNLPECTHFLAGWNETYTTIEPIRITDIGEVNRRGEEEEKMKGKRIKKEKRIEDKRIIEEKKKDSVSTANTATTDDGAGSKEEDEIVITENPTKKRNPNSATTPVSGRKLRRRKKCSVGLFLSHANLESTATKMKLVVATRLHLGRASSIPSDETIKNIIANLKAIADNHSLIEGYAIEIVIAVDATPKIKNYDYVQSVRSALHVNDTDISYSNIHILPVTPWGKFVPALNSLLLFANNQLQADLIMFISAEVNLSSSTVSTLCQHLIEDENVIVAGAALNGHQYHAALSRSDLSHQEVPLTGRTTPWNTLCVWNLNKLSLTGFSTVSDLGTSAGVEECVAIALLQKLFPKSEARLVKVTDIEWEESFKQDEERRRWHEEKMRSKIERAECQLKLLGLSGTVVHC